MRPRHARLVTRALFGTLVALVAVGTPVHAHHGRDFLLAQTAELPHAGDLFLLSAIDVVDEGDSTETEWEPTVLLGATSRLSLELHSHIAKEGAESFSYENTAPAVHIRLTPTHSAWGVALSGEYEISAIDEEADRVEARLIVSRAFRSLRWAANLVAEEEQSSEAAVEWRYALGFRWNATSKLDLGVEAQGGFESGDEQEVLGGLYIEPSDRWTFNIGVGTAVGSDGPDLSLRTSLVWRAK